MGEAFGRDKFAAQLLARKTLLLDQHNSKAILRKTNRRARPRRAGAYNCDVIFAFIFHYL